jgi:hypothetical protein
MLYWNEKMIRNAMYLPPNTRLIHKTNNRLTLITVFCFRVDPPSLLWRHMKPSQRHHESWLLGRTHREIERPGPNLIFGAPVIFYIVKAMCSFRDWFPYSRTFRTISKIISFRFEHECLYIFKSRVPRIAIPAFWAENI